MVPQEATEAMEEEGVDLATAEEEEEEEVTLIIIIIIITLEATGGIDPCTLTTALRCTELRPLPLGGVAMVTVLLRDPPTGEGEAGLRMATALRPLLAVTMDDTR